MTKFFSIKMEQFVREIELTTAEVKKLLNERTHGMLIDGFNWLVTRILAIQAVVKGRNFAKNSAHLFLYLLIVINGRENSWERARERERERLVYWPNAIPGRVELNCMAAYKVFINTIIHKEFRTLYLIRSNSNPPNPTLIYANLALPLSLSCTLMAKLNSEWWVIVIVIVALSNSDGQW